MTERTPPRYVPTLTEVVRTRPAPAPVAEAGPDQEKLVQRVMQKVDLSLDRRMREAIAVAVMEQTRALGPVLRERLEAVVREAVAEAVAQEMSKRG